MARHTNSGTQAAEPAGHKHPRPDLIVRLPLVRVLAREAWAAMQAKDLTHHDQDQR